MAPPPSQIANSV